MTSSASPAPGFDEDLSDEELLISPRELMIALEGDVPPVLLDVRWQLNGPSGAPAHAAGHIPGAHWIDLDAVLSGPPGANGRHPLPEPAVFGAAMRRAGLGADREVVVYDAADSMAAARAWWMLRWFGHRQVRILDGGYRAWTAQNLPVTTEPSAEEPGDFRPVPGGMPLLADPGSAAEFAAGGRLLDARAAERYRGEVEPIDPRAGHIPGAESLPTAANMTAEGSFRPPAELAARFAEADLKPGDQIAVYCGSGVSAAQQVVALRRAGIPSALYIGSWSEWSADPNRPIETGE